MAKYYGAVGYAEPYEKADGVNDERIIRRNYYGDVLRNYRRLENQAQINDDLNVSNTISIMADAYAYKHCYSIRYIEWMGSKWKVTGLEINRPRLILTIGGIYNGPED